jgi:prepilin-type N-terminal cleavage/methylation domain-containing protein
MGRDRADSQAGFTLIETLVATAILITVVASLSQLFGLVVATNRRAASRTLATVTARDKMEQLASMPWPALIASPAAVLEDDVEGYSDRVGGIVIPWFSRRWSIAPLPADPLRLVVLQVVVVGPGGRVEARLATVRRRAGA